MSTSSPLKRHTSGYRGDVLLLTLLPDCSSSGDVAPYLQRRYFVNPESSEVEGACVSNTPVNGAVPFAVSVRPDLLSDPMVLPNFMRLS
jgi:hypothetical protein